MGVSIAPQSTPPRCRIVVLLAAAALPWTKICYGRALFQAHAEHCHGRNADAMLGIGADASMFVGIVKKKLAC